jgi:hypothetical protein
MFFGAIVVPLSIILTYICANSGSPVANKITGQTYPVHMHGILYVTPLLGIAQECSVLLGGLAVLTGVVLRICVDRRDRS